MRIHYLSASEIPSDTANSVHVMQMCAAIARAGHEVVLFGANTQGAPNDPFMHYGVPRNFQLVRVRRVRRRWVGALRLAADTRRQVEERGLPDLFYGRFLYSLVALARHRVSIVYESHAPPLDRVRRHVESWLFRRPHFRTLVVISDALRREYVRLFPELNEDQIIVAHDGAAVPDGNPTLPVVDPSTASGRLQVGYVGHLYRGRGIDVIAALAECLPDFDFHLVGGTETDLENAMQRFTATNLNFHGFVPHGGLEPYFARFDVVLAPYQRSVAVAGGAGDTSKWMSPLKIFEYMAAGLPMIVSDLPVLREVLVHGKNALLVDPDDVGAWRRALEYLHEHPEVRHSLAASARQDLLSRYTWERRASRVLDRVT